MSIIDDLDCDALISHLAGPLSPSQRADFRLLPRRLSPILTCAGEGAAYRAIAALQKQYFDPPTFGQARWGTEREPRPSKLKNATPIAHAGDGQRIVP